MRCDANCTTHQFLIEASRALSTQVYLMSVRVSTLFGTGCVLLIEQMHFKIANNNIDNCSTGFTLKMYHLIDVYLTFIYANQFNVHPAAQLYTHSHTQRERHKGQFTFYVDCTERHSVISLGTHLKSQSHSSIWHTAFGY